MRLLSRNLDKEKSLLSQETLTKTSFSSKQSTIVGAVVKKTVLAVAVILAMLASMMAGMQTEEGSKANFFIGPDVWIESPCDWLVYTNTSIPFNVAARVHEDSPEIVCFLYCVDKNPNLTLTDLEKVPDLGGYEFRASSVLESLTEGNHTLKVYSQNTHGGEMSASVEFMIDTDFKSPLLVLSPQNATYFTTEVPLTFVCTEELRHIEGITMADYILDGMGAGYISENITLTRLSIGEHELTVVVWTVKGFFSQTVYFSVLQPEISSPSPESTPSPEPTPKPESFPTTLVVGAMVALPSIGIGLLVYFKKLKL